MKFYCYAAGYLCLVPEDPEQIVCSCAHDRECSLIRAPHLEQALRKNLLFHRLLLLLPLVSQLWQPLLLLPLLPVNAALRAGQAPLDRLDQQLHSIAEAEVLLLLE
jgi:hypothetical protein